MALDMTGSAGSVGGMNGLTPLWPADVIHVNEDGWVLINRGLAQGVVVGQRLLAVGPSVRNLRNLFAAHDDAPAPVVLQIRRTYEMLEVVYAERECAVAVATRAPIERRPEFYRGLSGELLVWVPLPRDYTYPPADADDNADGSGADDAENSASDVGVNVPIMGYPMGRMNARPDAVASVDETEDSVVGDSDDADGQVPYDQAIADEPPERVTQEDERWEEALPLNGVSVGDLVVPALPAAPTLSGLAAAPTTLSASAPTPAPTVAYDFATPVTHAATTVPGAEGTGHTSDWMKPLV